jgi:hypothetical protein
MSVLNPEIEEGNIEYKRELINLDEEKLNRFIDKLYSANHEAGKEDEIFDEDFNALNADKIATLMIERFNRRKKELDEIARSNQLSMDQFLEHNLYTDHEPQAQQPQIIQPQAQQPSQSQFTQVSSQAAAQQANVETEKSNTVVYIAVGAVALFTAYYFLSKRRSR